MVLEGVKHLVSYLGVCNTDPPPKWRYTAFAAALDLKTTLHGELVVARCQESCSAFRTPPPTLGPSHQMGLIAPHHQGTPPPGENAIWVGQPRLHFVQN